MPKFIIEREVDKIGSLNSAQLQGVAQTSCDALQKVGPHIQWIHSYVSGDKTYCLYVAPNQEAIREHARLSGFPANRISEIVRLIDANTAKA